MALRRKKSDALLVDAPPGSHSPLDAAVEQRDSKTLDLVAAAVSHQDTMLAFQPVMIARAPFGVAFYEGLIRVLDATGRVIPARDFIDQVEPTQLGRELDCISLTHGLRTLSKVPNIRVSINLSARSIGYRPWMRALDRWLARDSTIAERLILEITEQSAMTVPEIVQDFMAEMRQLGIAFAMDHFGSGCTSLRYFREYNFDVIKIASPFTKGIHADRDQQVLTAAILQIAREFDIFTVAERIEDERDAAFLTNIGIDCLQGNLFGAATIRPPWIEELQEKKSRYAG